MRLSPASSSEEKSSAGHKRIIGTWRDKGGNWITGGVFISVSGCTNAVNGLHFNCPPAASSTPV